MKVEDGSSVWVVCGQVAGC